MKLLNQPDLAKLILRVGVSGMMLYGHGWPKLKKILVGDFTFPDPIGLGPLPSLLLAAFAEVLCSLAVIAGFRTRLAAIPLVITMVVAGFIQHWGDPWSDKEPALVFGVAFLAIVLLGAGRFSIDKS
jgi:putative oxidoreductase